MVGDLVEKGVDYELVTGDRFPICRAFALWRKFYQGEDSPDMETEDMLDNHETDLRQTLADEVAEFKKEKTARESRE